MKKMFVAPIWDSPKEFSVQYQFNPRSTLSIGVVSSD
jgi:hypothetical protein